MSSKIGISPALSTLYLIWISLIWVCSCHKKVPDRNQKSRWGPFQTISHQSGWWPLHLAGGERFLFHNVNPSPPAEIVCRCRLLLLLIFIRKFFGTPFGRGTQLSFCFWNCLFSILKEGHLYSMDTQKKGIWFCSALTHRFSQIESSLFLSMLLQLKKVGF